MERLKRGLRFWVLLLLAVALPASGQTTIKKVLYQAKVKIGVSGTGGALIQPKTVGWEYMVRSFAYPSPNNIVKVSLREDGQAWEIVLCENGGLAGDCTYMDDGNLDIEGVVNSSMLLLAGISGATFSNALKYERMIVYFEDGAKGSGTFVRIF